MNTYEKQGEGGCPDAHSTACHPEPARAFCERCEGSAFSEENCEEGFPASQQPRRSGARDNHALAMLQVLRRTNILTLFSISTYRTERGGAPAMTFAKRAVLVRSREASKLGLRKLFSQRPVRFAACPLLQDSQF
jgi:hypothetical protein